MKVRLKWEPRDLWLGVYWNVNREGQSRQLLVYVCLLPCLPIVFTFKPKLRWTI